MVPRLRGSVSAPGQARELSELHRERLHLSGAPSRRHRDLAERDRE